MVGFLSFKENSCYRSEREKNKERDKAKWNDIVMTARPNSSLMNACFHGYV